MKVDSVFYDDFFEEPEIYWALAVEKDRCTYVPIPAEEIENRLPDGNLSSTDYDKQLCEVCLSYLQDHNFSLSDLPKIEEASPALQSIFEDFWSSENDNYFIEESESSFWESLHLTKEEFIGQMDADIEKFNLSDVIAKDEYDALYCVFPELLSSFSTKDESLVQSIDKSSKDKAQDKKDKKERVGNGR